MVGFDIMFLIVLFWCIIYFNRLWCAHWNIQRKSWLCWPWVWFFLLVEAGGIVGSSPHENGPSTKVRYYVAPRYLGYNNFVFMNMKDLKKLAQVRVVWRGNNYRNKINNVAPNVWYFMFSIRSPMILCFEASIWRVYHYIVWSYLSMYYFRSYLMYRTVTEEELPVPRWGE